MICFHTVHIPSPLFLQFFFFFLSTFTVTHRLCQCRAVLLVVLNEIRDIPEGFSWDMPLLFPSVELYQQCLCSDIGGRSVLAQQLCPAAGHIMIDPGHVPGANLGTLLAHVQPAVHQCPQLPFCLATVQPLCPQPVELQGLLWPK